MEGIVEMGRIQSKDQVLRAVDKKICESDSGRISQSAEYNQKVVQELKNFRDQVEERKLFSLKDSDWQYAIIVRGIGISLAMEHITTKYSGILLVDNIDERYEMIRSKAEGRHDELVDRGGKYAGFVKIRQEAENWQIA